jgi:RNA polymerase sigma factor (sigma-70 family)
MLVSTSTDRWRRVRSRVREVHLGSRDRPGAVDELRAVDDRDTVLRALRALPPRQRAVLVLRYWEDLSEAETAQVLQCGVGTVKSSASRGLARLREEMTRAPVPAVASLLSLDPTLRS